MTVCGRDIPSSEGGRDSSAKIPEQKRMRGTHLHKLLAIWTAVFPEVGWSLDDGAEQTSTQLLCAWLARDGSWRSVLARHAVSIVEDAEEDVVGDTESRRAS